MQHCPTYFNNFYSSSSSSSLCSPNSNTSSQSFTTESTNTYKNSTFSSPIPCNTRIQPMLCLPIHSPSTPDSLNTINKHYQQSISPIHNPSSPSLINISIQKETISTNSITSNNSSHSSQNKSSPQITNNSTSHSLSDKPIQKQPIDNPYITDNLLYGDSITKQNYPTSRIVYNNVNGLDLFTNSVTLETMCDYMYMHNVDVACMSETNAHWKNQRCYNKCIML